MKTVITLIILLSSTIAINAQMKNNAPLDINTDNTARVKDYYIGTILNSGFDEAVEKTKEALKKEGFGVITEIDMQAKLKEKAGVDYKRYIILGACNPPAAYKALQAEEKIGVLLPCNVVVIDKENGTTEIAAINPTVSMMAVRNPALEPLAKEITEKLQRVINSLK